LLKNHRFFIVTGLTILGLFGVLVKLLKKFTNLIKNKSFKIVKIGRLLLFFWVMNLNGVTMSAAS